MKKTTVDFWRLIWQERPEVIAMLTNLKEGTKSKCEQYWPDTQMKTKEIGPFEVTLLDENILPDFTTRTFVVKVSCKK